MISSLNAGPLSGRMRIMLVDDHEMIRKGVRSLIETVPHWVVCAEAGDAREAIRVVSDARPDVAVLDVSMPVMNGVELIPELKKLLPKLEILVLTMHDSERIAAQALRAGARGYLLKSESGDKLIEALTALSRHQLYFSGAVSETLLKFYLHSDLTQEYDELTPRERQVVKLVAEGNSNKRAAIILKVSVKTIETHRAAAMRKIGAKSSVDLALYAVRNDLVQA